MHIKTVVSDVPSFVGNPEGLKGSDTYFFFGIHETALN